LESNWQVNIFPGHIMSATYRCHNEASQCSIILKPRVFPVKFWFSWARMPINFYRAAHQK